MPLQERKRRRLGQLNPFRYRGYYYDSESGLYYLNSRYYDAETGRFLNADGYVSTGQGVLGYNMFAYCNNNPVNMSDDDGNIPGIIIPILVGIGIAAVTAVAGIAVKNSSSSGMTANLGKEISQTINSVKNFPKLMSVMAAAKIYETKVEKQAEKLTDIASGYEVLKCDKAAEAMKAELLKKKEHGNFVTLIFPGDKGNKHNFVWSESRGMVVSENGFHCGIEYKGRVYCNIHPEGLPKEEWVNDFIGPWGEPEVNAIPF